jgi:dihydroflavonol-4-reductase
MKILVTGADGLLGSNLIRELISRQHEVSALVQEDRIYITLVGLPISIIKGDLIDAKSINNACTNIDVVIHCAANTSMFPPRQEAVKHVNISGTQNIIDACKVNKVKRLIYVGTANSFNSGSIDHPGDETNAYTATKYGLDYMDSKYEAQRLVLKEAAKGTLDALVVNPTFMIGPYDSRPSSGEMILGIYFKKIPGYTLGGKNFVAVKDVAFAIANSISLGQKGQCYILGHENLSYKEAFEKISSVLNAPALKFKLSTGLVRFYGKTNSFLGKFLPYHPKISRELAILASESHFYSSEKAITELKMPQTPLEIAIAECYAWFDENNYLKKVK